MGTIHLGQNRKMNDTSGQYLGTDYRTLHLKDPHAKVAPNGYQSALSITLQPNHTINTINSNTYHLLEKVTKIHKRQVYNPKNE